MKKIVPDPPVLHPFNSPYFSIHSDLVTADSLAFASELMRGIHETTNEFCRTHANDPSHSMLLSVLHSAEMAKALVEHALANLLTLERGFLHE